MGPSPSWTPLSNQRLMAYCPSLCTGNLHTLTSTYSGTVTITSQPNSVYSTPSPLWQQGKPELLQQEREHLRKALTKCKYPKWALDKVEKRLNRSTRQVSNGGTTGGQPATNEVKNKVTLSYPTQKVFAKVSKRSEVDMAFKPTSKVVGPSKASWSPPRTKILWSTKVVPSTGTNVVT